jgi:acetoacetyl-CoA synthetase
MYPRPDFFAGALLNFAENMLFPKNNSPADSATAAINVTELEGSEKRASWGELREAVRRSSSALRAAGVKPNDVVAGFVSNHVEAIVASLGAAAVGAVWTGISPDNGVGAVLDRLVQIAPKVLFADNGMTYNGKKWVSTEKTLQVVDGLKDHGLELVVVINNVDAGLGLAELSEKGPKAVDYDEFLKSAPSAEDEPLKFEQLPPSHPLYVLYSSGTTGLPKAIVHTALGTLLQHKKELYLHCSVDHTSTMLYYTTTSWMMWHWSIAALSCGATLVLYTGSPFKPHGYLSMPKLLAKYKATHFGTSASYLTALETNNVFLVPQQQQNGTHENGVKQIGHKENGEEAKEEKVESEVLDLSHLQAIYSTASPLPPSTFAFIYKSFPSRISLGSITGGTDIISLFGAPCPLLPVYQGEIQCAGLGMAIGVADSASPTLELLPNGKEGELVCTQPFPCQPLTFWGPGGDAKYRASYFERFEEKEEEKGAAATNGNGEHAPKPSRLVWHHGDFVRIGARTGGLTMLGRSDGVLKPSGVRFGSAEIYNVLTRHFAAEVEDAVCVGRRRASDRDETVCLFVAVRDGHAFSPDLADRIRVVVRTELSPRHVPAVVEEAGGGIPKTGNGKK